MEKARTLEALFSFPGFIAKNKLKGKFGDPKVRFIDLERKKKPLPALFVDLTLKPFMTEKFVLHVIVMQKAIKSIFVMKDVEYIAGNVWVFMWRA